MAYLFSTESPFYKKLPFHIKEELNMGKMQYCTVEDVAEDMARIWGNKKMSDVFLAESRKLKIKREQYSIYTPK